ncbi:unnamed protein product [Orchesella dallaii]|uniref:THUMP domain-containing protein n=1 Tax=Orchesella dallaii TaxID=48710 RepID=A0ABP1QFI2_9HEXA
MGKASDSNSGGQRQDGFKRKSKGRMSYLKRHRAGQGSNQAPVKEDESGLRYGGYEPAYGSKSKSSWKSYGGGGGRRPRENLRSGMKGFICTTNMRERECVREAYNILNEYAEDKKGDDESENRMETEGDEEKQCSASASVVKLESGSTADNENDPTSSSAISDAVVLETSVKDKVGLKQFGDDEDEDLDIDAALANELKELKSEKSVKKFQSVDTGVNNVIFISTTLDDPTELAYRIFDDVTAKKETKSRFLLRLLPIEMTCNANNLDEVKARAKEILEKYMKTGYNSFRVVANVRFNGKFGKEQLIKIMAEVVSQVNPLNVVDLKNAQYTVVVEVLKTTLCLAVVKEFTKFRKYNLLEAGTPTPPPTSEETPVEPCIKQEQCDPVEPCIKQEQCDPVEPCIKQEQCDPVEVTTQDSGAGVELEWSSRLKKAQ